jgi:hypothetical protein
MPFRSVPHDVLSNVPSLQHLHITKSFLLRGNNKTSRYDGKSPNPSLNSSLPIWEGRGDRFLGPARRFDGTSLSPENCLKTCTLPRIGPRRPGALSGVHDPDVCAGCFVRHQLVFLTNFDLRLSDHVITIYLERFPR